MSADQAHLRLSEEDRRLLEEVRRIGQQATALMRGLLVSLPKPTPPGDWGRSSASPEPSRQRVVGADAEPGPKLVEAPQSSDRPPIEWPPDNRLLEIYYEQGGNIASVARRLGLPSNIVLKRFREKLQVPMRNREPWRRSAAAGAPRRIEWPPEAKMRALYAEHGGNIAAIARRLKRPYLQLYRHFRYQLGLTARIEPGS